ncbi:MAG: hypothetical protein WCH99_12665 [Verrucomicrobiota bacterium]
MTNLVAAVTNKLLITTAYKQVALAVMLTNCNWFAQETHLPLSHPLVQTNVILPRCSVAPPRLMGFSGSVVTEKYFFGFGHDHLANFWQWEFRPTSETAIKEQNARWSKMTSLIGTNEVHQLALNWLMNLGVDVPAMEKNYPCTITQRFSYQNRSGALQAQAQAVTRLPVFEISWGSIPLSQRPEYKHPAVTMTIFGPTRELIEYHLYDDYLMMQPKLAVNDYEQLLEISNETFQKYDHLQRENLVKRFTTPRSE